ncbi:MAG: ATP-binding protein [Desulfovibrionaceae bacterium]
MGTDGRETRRLNKTRMAAAVVVVLAVFVMSIVWMNYTSQVELRHAFLDQFGDQAAKDAVGLKHFFLDRQNDLDDLSASRELLAYFENKALGMTRDYGLWASLTGISELFSRFMGKKALDGRRMYRRIAFFDDQGGFLADNSGVSGDGLPLYILEGVDSGGGRLQFHVEDKDGSCDILVAMSYAYKDASVGVIVAWINTTDILPALMRRSQGAFRHSMMYFVHQNSIVYSTQAASPELALDVREGHLSPPNTIVERIYPSGRNEAREYLAVRSLVEGTPFSLVAVITKADVLGTVSPLQLLASTIALAVLVLGGTVMLLRMSAKNLILDARIAEADLHAQRIQDKNAQLEEEVLARERAEALLQRANEVLESRVEERTATLEEQAAFLEREVLERREAEIALRTIFNNTHDAIFMHDGNGKILDVNERLLELFRLNRDEALSMSILDDYSSPRNQLGRMEDAWELALGGDKVVLEWLCRRPHDGVEFDVEMALSRIEVLGQMVVLVNLHDISEQKRVQTQQKEHQEFLKTIFEGIGAAIFVFDPSLKTIVDCNTISERLLSLHKKDIVSGNLNVEFPFMTHVKRNLLKPDWNAGNAYEEGVLVLPGGEHLPIARHLFDIHMGGKKHLVQVVFDITERKNLERRLQLAKKLESIGLLAAGIAHEINTPIQYVGDSVHFVKESFQEIEGLLELYAASLEHGQPVEAESDMVERVAARKQDMDFDFIVREVPKACDTALDGVHRVASIVLAMKNFSHPGEEDARPSDINRSIEDTINVSRNEWKYVADMQTDLAQDLPFVHCQSSGINQALLNIIVNAAHAIAARPQGTEKGRITVTTQAVADAVEIRISDTGCGIPKENLQRVFDPFFTTKEVGKGTGQGLAIVHDIIVMKHGGSIDIESEVGMGTTIVIRLPVGGLERTETAA